MSIENPYDRYVSAYERIKEIIKVMNKMSEEEFSQKYMHDIAFHTGVKTLVRAICPEIKSEECEVCYGWGEIHYDDSFGYPAMRECPVCTSDNVRDGEKK